jgi:phosphoglycolate phosphatase-like HAD superfamily hydrolase
MGKTDPVLFEEVGAAYGLAPEKLAERADEVHTAYLAALTEELAEPAACEIKPGVERLVSILSARHDVALGLVSGNIERAAWLKLSTVGLDRFFAGGGFGSDGRRRADLVRIAVARFEVQQGHSIAPDQVWVIGDTPDDVAGGREHGVRTLAVATGSFARSELERCQADCVLDNLEDTARIVDILCGSR